MVRGVFIAVLGALLWAPLALAAAPGYKGQGGSVQSPLETPPKVHGGLPFTGLDISLLVLGAALLLIVGASLRRFARSKA